MLLQEKRLRDKHSKAKRGEIHEREALDERISSDFFVSRFAFVSRGLLSARLIRMFYTDELKVPYVIMQMCANLYRVLS